MQSSLPTTLTRSIATVAMFGALGNVLAILSTQLANIHPQIAVDLSHLGTLCASALLGPYWGCLTGAIVSLTPFYRFSIQGYLPPLLGALIVPGKAMTGLFAGALMRKGLRPSFSTLLGYIPESIFTYFVMTTGVQALMPPDQAAFITRAVVLGILAKAWVEIVILSVLMEVLVRRLLRA